LLDDRRGDRCCCRLSRRRRDDPGGTGTHAESDDIESIEPGTTLTITGSGQAATVIEGVGAVFGFGDAAYRGSLPEIGVYPARIVALAATTSDRGYLVVGRNGGVYAFGNAAYSGSLPRQGARVNDIVGAATA
jgi:hypothetical protein